MSVLPESISKSPKESPRFQYFRSFLTTSRTYAHIIFGASAGCFPVRHPYLIDVMFDCWEVAYLSPQSIEGPPLETGSAEKRVFGFGLLEFVETGIPAPACLLT